jgi:hypothetical protein
MAILSLSALTGCSLYLVNLKADPFAQTNRSAPSEVTLKLTAGRAGAFLLEVRTTRPVNILWAESYFVDPLGGRHAALHLAHDLDQLERPVLPPDCRSYVDVLAREKWRLDQVLQDPAAYDHGDPLAQFNQALAAEVAEGCRPRPGSVAESTITPATEHRLQTYPADRIYYDAGEVCLEWKKLSYSRLEKLLGKIAQVANVAQCVKEALANPTAETWIIEELVDEEGQAVRDPEGQPIRRRRQELPPSCQAGKVPEHYYECARSGFVGTWRSVWLPPASLFQAADNETTINGAWKENYEEQNATQIELHLVILEEGAPREETVVARFEFVETTFADAGARRQRVEQRAAAEKERRRARRLGSHWQVVSTEESGR